ncbi:hypothetical protein DFH09DRAFT_1145520 [Mycena vulgaris]|nr:hypothetical protein DFH09DRAFT_1145520 [Mycena vulgaris]
MEAPLLPMLSSLPYEIILDITECTRSADVLNLSLTSQEMRSLLIPRLYRSMLLGSSEACSSALPMFRRHPDVCECVRELVVRPNCRSSWPEADTTIDETWVVDELTDSCKNLKSLQTFEWDGAELAGDHLWMALRYSCFQLKGIRCTTGFREFPPRSQLFEFQNLSEFSLRFQPDIDRPPSGKGWTFPVELWNMLARCPDLEILNLSSSDASVQYVPIRDLTNGYWPRLRSLTLTLMQYEVEHRLEALRAFVLAHNTIKHLAIHPRTWNRAPQHTLFAPTALPVLFSFTGAYFHLEQLPSPGMNQILDLASAPVPRSVLETFLTSLRRFGSLTTLYLRLNDRVLRAELQALASSCPGLVHLHLTFVEYAEIPLYDIRPSAKALRDLLQLRTFSLEKGYILGDSTVQTALLFIRYVPGVRELKLRWMDHRSRNRLKEQGTYTMVDESRGRYLDAWERGFEMSGDNVTFSRRYQQSVPQGQHEDESGSDEEWD